MHQDLGVGEFAAQQVQLDALELVMHQAGALPQQHVGTGFLLDVAAEVLVRRPENLFAARV
ncbi:hypothetical protein D3C86_2045310 [compost metagenome]